MVIPNNERVGRGLDAVRDGILPICEATWRAHYGDDWLTEVSNRDRIAGGPADPSDVSFLLKGMHNTWQEVWRHQLGQSERAYTTELRDARNDWAHQKQFSTDDAYRMLDTAERLLQAFSAVDQLKVVQGLKRDLQRQQFDEQARSERRKTAAKPTEGEPSKGLQPWREVITPHTDVQSGRFEQAEFAADLYQVATNNADVEYQDPVSFFRRTYLTNGLRELLLGAARRLSGDGGDPVVDLQTNFGGGKTHSMIALYHLASGAKGADLPGIGDLLAEEKLTLPANVARAVIVGQWLSPASPSTKPDGTEVHTIWGEIAYQLAGRAGYDLLEPEDLSGTNPGTKLIDLFRLAGPSIILIDEWVAYARQLPSRENEPSLIAGDFDTQFTFAQALTEAAAAVPNVVVLVSIPASDIEVGGDKGQDALARLRNVVRRKSAQWKPAEDDESFEIVRRRLFEPMTPENARVRDGVIKAFCEYYRDKKVDFPSEVTESEYRRRMELSYPIHPELFDRLYKDWSTLDRFQRTRGVLRLMATVISVLWREGDQNLLIMPGTIPMYDARVNSELTKYLDDGWDPVIKSDIDGSNALPLRLDQQNPNLGRYSATRRVARAVYLASAPREEDRRGIDIKTITLGVAQPSEAPGTFADALRRLSGDATYLYVDGARYWYSLRANITRLASDRANSNFNDENADDEIKRRLTQVRELGPFVALHAFPDGPGDVTDDDDGVHLVVLPTSAHHVPNVDVSLAITMANDILSQRNAGPRLNRNMLVFAAPSEARLVELRAAARQFLAWQSILQDQSQDKIELTKADEAQARSKVSETDRTVTDRITETYQHVLVPEQTAGTKEIRWHQTKPTGSGSLPQRVARKLESEERLITVYGGARVRMDLDRIPLWSARQDITIGSLWKAYAQFPYLPRLASFDVLAMAVADGVAKLTWDTETFAYAEAHDDKRWVGLVAAQQVVPRGSGYIVAGAVAKQQMEVEARSEPGTGSELASNEGTEAGIDTGDGRDRATKGTGSTSGFVGQVLPESFYGKFSLDTVRAIRQLEEILQNVVEHLARADGGSVELTLEINANSVGYDDRTQRVVKENASQLNARGSEFE
jgi:predicted AAA+ superfamily ATPase